MLRKGKWIADEQLNYKPKVVGYRLNTLYSPWVSFAEVAKEFLKSKDDPTSLMNFVNSWLGEPWKSKSSEVKAKAVLDKKTDIPHGIVPHETLILTAGVDRQQGYFYWVVRAWMPGMRSTKIANGSAETWDDLKAIMDQYWPVENSKKIRPVHKGQQLSVHNAGQFYVLSPADLIFLGQDGIQVPAAGPDKGIIDHDILHERSDLLLLGIACSAF